MYIKYLATNFAERYNKVELWGKEVCAMSFMEQLLLEDVDDLVFLDDIWSRSDR